jgi:hypothetical protein
MVSATQKGKAVPFPIPPIRQKTGSAAETEPSGGYSMQTNGGNTVYSQTTVNTSADIAEEARKNLSKSPGLWFNLLCL